MSLEPLSTLPPERLRAVAGVLFDVDDTLTTEGRLEASTFAALWRLREAGLHLMAVTGRPLGWADAFAATWPVDAAVGENGAGWAWRDGRALRTAYLDPPEAREGQQALLARIRREVRARLPDVVEATDQGARRCDLAFDIGEHERVEGPSLNALVELIEAAGARCTTSSVHCHAVPGDWDKARGALGAAAALGLPEEPARWLFVGDSGNDAAAFAAFPVSVGVANVRRHLERLPTPPAYVASRACGAGFEEVAAALLGARR
jgi:HAD superfamily hydrolase (TIGR01484 family)